MLLKGLLIGLSIAAPVGPIGILCIRRTLAQGKMYGFVSGLGAASADAVYGLIAGLGLDLAVDFIEGHQIWLQLVGSLFLFYLGIKTFRSQASETPANAAGKRLIGAYSSVFFLTLTNPMTILSFAGIFAGLGFSRSHAGSALTLVLGVFAGSALWWILLSFGVGWFRNRIATRGLGVINRLAGAIIVGFGGLTAAEMLAS